MIPNEAELAFARAAELVADAWHVRAAAEAAYQANPTPLTLGAMRAAQYEHRATCVLRDESLIAADFVGIPLDALNSPCPIHPKMETPS